MVATAGLLGILGLPLEVQGYWTEHSERSVLPTGLWLMEVPLQDKDLLGRWKPEGSDTYARTFAGRVARLQALFAKVARGADRYDRLDEREIAADLVPWLMERAKLSREQAELTVSSLRRRWKEGDLGVPDSVSDIPAEGPPLDDPAAGAGTLIAAKPPLPNLKSQSVNRLRSLTARLAMSL